MEHSPSFVKFEDLMINPGKWEKILNQSGKLMIFSNAFSPIYENLTFFPHTSILSKYFLVIFKAVVSGWNSLSIYLLFPYCRIVQTLWLGTGSGDIRLVIIRFKVHILVLVVSDCHNIVHNNGDCCAVMCSSLSEHKTFVVFTLIS